MKTVISVIFSILTILLLSACSGGTGSNEREQNKVKRELSVYYVDYSEQHVDATYALTQLLEEYKNTNPDSIVVPTAFPNQESFMTQISAELAAGNGPDVFLLDAVSSVNWNKLALNGTLCNLSNWIDSDTNFVRTDYYQPVLDAGKIDDGQYVLPLAFNTISLFSNQEILEKSPLANGSYTYTDILKELKNSIEQAQKGDDIIPLALSLNRTDYLTCLMQAFGMSVINFDSNSIAIDRSVLFELCDFLKSFWPYAHEAFANRDNHLTNSEDGKNIQYMLNSLPHLGTVIQREAMANVLGQQSEWIRLPKYDSPQEYSAYICFYAAITSNSDNPQSAYQLVKSLMDLAQGDNIGQNFPVKRQNLDEWLQEYEDYTIRTPIDGELIPVEIDIERIRQIAESSNCVLLENFNAEMIVIEEMEPYIEGKSSFDDCYEKMINKLQLYINE